MSRQGHVRRVQGRPPRIVRPRRRSDAAAHLVESAVSWADDELPDVPVVGHVVIAVYKTGAVQKSVFEPSMEDQGMGQDMFWALVQTALSRLMVAHLSGNKAREVHNELHRFDEGDDT